MSQQSNRQTKRIHNSMMNNGPVIKASVFCILVGNAVVGATQFTKTSGA